MRIVTFNIKNGLGSAGRVDVPGLARVCAGFEADILALQEVDRRARRSGWSDQVAQVARATGMAAAFGEAARRGRFHRYGNAFLARGRIADVEVLSLPRPTFGEPRVAILATVTVGGTAVSVAATHLSFREKEGPVQLEALVGLLDRKPPPRLILGDLNLGPDVVEPVLGAAGYEIAATPPTYPADTPRLRIDYVAVAGMTLISAEAPVTGISDHRPVVVEACCADGRPGPRPGGFEGDG